MPRNNVVLVDIDDNDIGIESKKAAHCKPILHRAFSIFLYNDNYELLVQKRALNKYHSPGLWSNTCCSHPQKGENIKTSALNRLMEEVGINTDIEEIFSFVYMNKFDDNLFEYELDHVFIGNYNGEVILNYDEACDAKWISLEYLKKDLINNPLSYSSWFIVSAPKVIKYLENKKIG